MWLSKNGVGYEVSYLQVNRGYNSLVFLIVVEFVGIYKLEMVQLLEDIKIVIMENFIFRVKFRSQN